MSKYSLINTKIVRLLKSLSQKEVKDFTHWLANQSPTTNSAHQKLLGALLLCYPECSADKLDKTTIFKQSFPDRAFSGNYLRKQCNALYVALQSWMVQEQADEQWKELLFLKQLQKRKADHDFELFIGPTKASLEQYPYRDAAFFERNYLLAQEQDRYFGRQQERRYDPAIQQQSDALDHYFIIQKLRLACEMLNRNRIIQANYEPQLVPEILRLIEEKPRYREVPAIAIYRQVWNSLQVDFSEADYKEFVNLLLAHPSTFPPAEMREIYRYAQNYCIRQINNGQRDFLQHLLKLYQHQLHHGLFLLDGVFPANDFKNIVTLGLQLESFPWVRQFLEDYRQYLSPVQADNVYNYSLAQLYYTTKAYDQAVNLLREVRFTDRYYDINGSIMLLKIYLTQADYFSFHYFLDAYKIRMQRNREVAAAYRKSIINFLKICKRIADLQERSPYLKMTQFQSRYQKVEAQLSTIKPLFDRRWLQQELEKLKRNT